MRVLEYRPPKSIKDYLKYTTGRYKRKGFFLIFTLWLFLLISLFCLGLGFRTFIAVRKTKLFLNRTRAQALAISGIKLARKVLEEDDTSPDHLQEDWAKFKDEEREIEYFYPKKKGKIKVSIEDEISRLNINDVDDSTLQELFDNKNIENADEKINYILDYIDKDYDYRGQDSTSEEGVKNEDLSVVEELLLVANTSKEDYNKIEDLLTVFSGEDGRLNINTAKRDLLDILIDDDGLRNKVFDVRFGPNLIEGDDDDGYYGEEGETFPTELEETFKITSDVFRIVSEAEIEDVKRKISCVINRDSGKILYWYEE